jgi:hypothetical protein
MRIRLGKVIRMIRPTIKRFPCLQSRVMRREATAVVYGTTRLLTDFEVTTDGGYSNP